MKTALTIVAWICTSGLAYADLASDPPSVVKNYATRASLSTGQYKSDGDMVRACSTYVEIPSPSADSLKNNIAYYIEGSFERVAQVRLVLNVNSPVDSEQALQELSKAAAVVVANAVGKPIPAEITKAILKYERDQHWRTGVYDIKLTLIKWNTGSGSYTMRFTIDVVK
ncbi:hypothetical protein [Roseimicrobium sp. ORNL1]|uniref:hypothetical protein n=1 Tax=Roseimicrobium sp. ORNL1 TaxID=2711231 RepID=UPI0013E0FE29|nr:hypothetical protein [Roseimicrobium sp. ORNL1]QIF03711.1 hypothetical protein G5S37_20030 [Roseimicrobium sp. ORNL1]